MLLAILVMATMFGLIAVSFVFLQSAKQSISQQLAYEGQTTNAAQAGLVDTLSWFRRQTVQPVSSFAPVLDATASPPVNETDDASVGLVRQYEISDLGNVWGRYEVRISEVADVSQQRGKDNAGSVWELTSHGYVYIQHDDTKSYDESPNRILTQVEARTEIQRLTLVPPANAAINADRGDAVSTASSTRIFSDGNIGIAYPNSTGSPSRSGEVKAAILQSTVADYNSEISAVFGVSQQELIAMADIRAASAADLPDSLPGMSLVVITGNATFTSAQPLSGVGVLVVFGDLTLSAGSASSYNGLIYVTGDYTQGAPSSISGVVIAKGDVAIQGSSDFSEVNYDQSILSQIQRSLGQYRFTRNQTFTRIQ
ncbi:hypothetical protein ABI59_08370 [Acidobacteria bacterium Mor1]|nr:hypothetical protein ABI59_08370 [Acidobacteria bacterium Mor1]